MHAWCVGAWVQGVFSEAGKIFLSKHILPQERPRLIRSLEALHWIAVDILQETSHLICASQAVSSEKLCTNSEETTARAQQTKIKHSCIFRDLKPATLSAPLPSKQSSQNCESFVLTYDRYSASQNTFQRHFQPAVGYHETRARQQTPQMEGRRQPCSQARAQPASHNKTSFSLSLQKCKNALE